MQYRNKNLLFSPSDLITFTESPFASALERQKLSKTDIAKLIDPEDPLLVKLQQKGYSHEEEFAKSLANDGHEVLKIKRASNEQMAAQTLQAMQTGQEIIVQGYLAHGQFAGFVDFLVRVPGSSRFGDYEYEVWDTKLSKKLKPYFAIQLCCYSEMLETIQGVCPKNFAVVLGDGAKEVLSVHKYFSYFQSLKNSFLQFHHEFCDQLPDATRSVNYGRWSNLAEKQLEEKDHLSQVANLTRQQIKNLEKSGILTVQLLAEFQGDVVSGISQEVLQKAKTQASLQIESRDLVIPEYIILPHAEGEKRGLAVLPPHSDKDVFFDIEGYPYPTRLSSTNLRVFPGRQTGGHKTDRLTTYSQPVPPAY